MAVGALEHRIRTGLYNSRSTMLRVISKGPRPLVSGNCTVRHVLWLASVMTIAAPIVRQTLLLATTTFNVLLQTRVISARGAICDAIHQATLNLSVANPAWIINQLAGQKLVISAFLLPILFCLLVKKEILVIKKHGTVAVSVKQELQIAGYSLLKCLFVLLVLTLLAGDYFSLLLLKAGDIESNPGPTILNIDDHLMPIKEAIWEARSQWRDIGRKLRLKEGDIRALHEPSDGECLHEVLAQWIHSGVAVINTLLQALESEVVGRSDIARKIRSFEGVKRTEIGLGDSGGDLSEKPSLDELCSLPDVHDVWYPLGLWLGLCERELNLLKAYPCNRHKLMFARFFDVSLPDAGSWTGDTESLIECAQQTKSSAEAQMPLTYAQLVRGLVKVGVMDLAEDICSKKGVSVTGYLNLPECVAKYASYLKGKYMQMSVLPDPDWPPTVSVKDHYTNLALVQKPRSSLPRQSEIKQLSENYACGSIENIVSSSNLEEVFYPIIHPSTNESRLTILVDGAPGVGKTTITRKMCIDWARGTLLRSYQAVILVPLRELKTTATQDLRLSDILPCDNKELQAEIIKHLNEVSGMNAMIIFDGFDELSAKERSSLEQSLLLDIIQGKMLHRLSVVITSRQYASQPLRSLSRVNRHIEVLGFDAKQVCRCIRNYIPDEKGKKLMRELKQRFDIASLCYIPLNCRIVVFVYEREGYCLPSTLTELYEIFLLHTIKHYTPKMSIEKHVRAKIESARQISDLPESVLVQLNILSKFALEGIEQGMLVFEDSCFKGCLSLGLLNTLHCTTSIAEVEFYQFLHLTIQEFLAARYVALKPPGEKRDFLKSNVKHKSLRTTLLFVAGMTGFDFLLPDDSLLASDSIFLPGRTRHESLLLVAQLIYESKSSSGRVTPFLNFNLNISGYKLSDFDIVVLANFLSCTPKDYIWECINLSDCDISDFSTLLNTNHSIHLCIPAIAMTKKLVLESNTKPGNIDIATATSFLSRARESPLLVVYLPNLEVPRDQTCSYQLSKAICKLETVYFGSQTMSMCKKNLSAGQYVTLCSSFAMILHKIAIDGRMKSCYMSGHPEIFQDCSKCASRGKDAVEALEQLLSASANIEEVNLANCGLSEEVQCSVMATLSKKKKIREVNIEGNLCVTDERLEFILACLPKNGICKTRLSSSLYIGVLENNHLYAEVISIAHCENDYYFLKLLQCNIVASQFSELGVEIKGCFTDEIASALMSSTHLTSLSLKGIELNNGLTFRTVLEKCKFLRHLKLLGCCIGDYGCLFEGLNLSCSVSCLEMDWQQNVSFATITMLPYLCTLHVSDVSFRMEDIHALKRSIADNKLTSLQLRKCFKNDNDSDFIYELTECLWNNTSLKEIDLSDNAVLCDSLWAHLFPSIKSSSITMLDISHSNLDCTALSTFLHQNKTLTSLKASFCELTNEAVLSIADVLFNADCSLKELDISGNLWGGLSRRGMNAVLEALRQNRSLLRLNVFDCFEESDSEEDEKEFATALSETLAINKGLRELAINLDCHQNTFKTLLQALLQNRTLQLLKCSEYASQTLEEQIENLTEMSCDWPQVLILPYHKS